MIGLMLLAFICIWLVVTVILSIKIPRWLGLKKHQTVISVILFPLILATPIADDLIGMWQFKQLCEKEAVITLSPDWESVRKAIRIDLSRIKSKNTMIRIYGHAVQYKDVETGRIFLTSQWFATSGGFLRRHSGLVNPEQCLPKNKTEIYKKVDIDRLINK